MMIGVTDIREIPDTIYIDIIIDVTDTRDIPYTR